jgi:hypothetical protein
MQLRLHGRLIARGASSRLARDRPSVKVLKTANPSIPRHKGRGLLKVDPKPRSFDAAKRVTSSGLEKLFVDPVAVDRSKDCQTKLPIKELARERADLLFVDLFDLL